MSNESQKKRPVKLREFLAQHAVFTVDEIDRFLSIRGSGKTNTRKSLLTYYRKQQRIIPVRRGLYATVPLDSNSKSTLVDPYLLAAKMTKDAVLAYHTALEFHGKAYSVHAKFYYITKNKSLPLKFQNHEFRCAPIPHPLKSKGKEMFGVNRYKRMGVEIQVTNIERTFVDVLDRPDLSGSWEEVWRSLESVEFFDLDQIIEYVLILENATTAAKVGFYLDQHRESLMVNDVYLNRLQNLRPQQTHYLLRSKRKDCRWVKEWNLMIPNEILNKSWGEVL